MVIFLLGSNDRRAMLSTFNKPQLKGSILLKKSFKAPLIEEFFEISFRGWNRVRQGQEVNSGVQELTASIQAHRISRLSIR